MERERQIVGREDCAFARDLDLVRLACVVEARLDLGDESHRAPHDADQPHQLVAVGGRPVG